MQTKSRLETNEKEMTTIRDKQDKHQIQGKQLREEQRLTELKCRLETEQTKQQDEFNTMKDQLNEFQRQGDLLRQQQQRVTKLQSQLETKEQELATTKKTVERISKRRRTIKGETTSH